MAQAQNKTTETEASVEDFLNALTDEKKKTDAFKILRIMKAITKKPAKMWGTSIIGFDVYHYKYESGREGDFMKVGFSPRAQNLTLYIMPGFDRYEELLKSLGKYKTGKSCLYIKKLEDIDEQVLKTLIAESFEYMTKKYG